MLFVAVRNKRKQQATRLHSSQQPKAGTSKHSKQHTPVAATTSQLTTVQNISHSAVPLAKAAPHSQILTAPSIYLQHGWVVSDRG
jgi:hypothetical protein